MKSVYHPCLLSTSRLTVGNSWIDALRWPAEGLLPAIAQDASTGEVLMVAWMNREALERTVQEGFAVYWSRSRGRLWKKGEQSGHVQRVREVRLDCDGDTLLLKVEQRGGIACHTGRRHCFFRRLEDDSWVTVESGEGDAARTDARGGDASLG